MLSNYNKSQNEKKIKKEQGRQRIVINTFGNEGENWINLDFGGFTKQININD